MCGKESIVFVSSSHWLYTRTIIKGVRIEAVGSIRPNTIQHVVPSALPINSDVFIQTLDLEEGELYAFTIVDTSGNGLQNSVAPSKSRSYHSPSNKGWRILILL